MFPYITIFGRMFTSYAIMSLLGIFASGIFMCWLTRKRKLNDNDTIVLLLFSAIGVLLGGHILYGITNLKFIPEIFAATDLKGVINALVRVLGGSVFYGGLIGGLIVGFITIRVRKLDFSIFSDMAAVVIPLFHSFARVGCFLSGCCYGIESEFGITVHNNTLVADINGVNRFPVQLLEALLNVILFFILLILYKKSLTKERLQGKILLIYLSSYSIIRFFDEFLRGDEIRGFVLGLSTSQFISIFIFVVSATVFVALKIKNNNDIKTGKA